MRELIYYILEVLAHKYNFEYAENKLVSLSTVVKKAVDDKAKYTNWSHRDNVKSDVENGFNCITDRPWLSTCSH